MRAPLRTGWLRRLARDRSGVAAVEFAIVVPMLLVLYMGASELSIGVTLNRKLQGTASTTADLVGQLEATTKTEIGSILKIARALVEPYNSSKVKIILSSVTIDAQGKAKVDWSQAINGAVAYRKAAPYDLPDAFAAQRNRSFVVTEVDYTYQPLGGYGLNAAIPMHESAYLTPRNTLTQIKCPDC